MYIDNQYLFFLITYEFQSQSCALCWVTPYNYLKKILLHSK